MATKPPPKAFVPPNAPVPPTSPPHGHGPHAPPHRPPVEEPKAKVRDAKVELDPLDPTMRVTAHLLPPATSPPAAIVEEVAVRSRVSLEEVIPQVLRRIAWGGDRLKGAVHLELTSGDKVTVHAEGRRVRVEVEGNAELERRIGSRLRAAGIEVESVR